MYETIDLLQQTTDYYYIDYIPYNTDDPNFLEGVSQSLCKPSN